jgi:hypothetical protein
MDVQRGYVHQKGLDKPPPEIVDGLDEEFKALSVQDQAGEAPSLSARGGPRCKQFIEHGIDVSLLHVFSEIATLCFVDFYNK